MRYYHCGGNRLVFDDGLSAGRQAWNESDDVWTVGLLEGEFVVDALFCMTVTKGQE